MFMLQGYPYIVNLLTGLGLPRMCPGSRSVVHIAVTWGKAENQWANEAEVREVPSGAKKPLNS